MKSIISRWLLPAVIITSMLTLTGCHTARRQTVSPGNIIITPSKVTPQERMGAVIDSLTEWSSAVVPVSVTLEIPARMSFSGRAYMERDKSVYISLRKLGFEVAQLYVTNDSIFAVDKFNRRYLAESLEEVLERCPVSIRDIQNLLMGQPFIPGGTVSVSGFSYDEVSGQNSWLAFPVRQPSPAQLGYVFSLDDNTLSALAVDSPAGMFTTQYSDFALTPGGLMSGTDRLAFRSEKLNVSAQWKWSWNQAVWNTSSELRSFSLPVRGYTRIAAASLLKSLKPQQQQQ